MQSRYECDFLIKSILHHHAGKQELAHVACLEAYLATSVKILNAHKFDMAISFLRIFVL